jgi:hypothetical protein
MLQRLQTYCFTRQFHTGRQRAHICSLPLRVLSLSQFPLFSFLSLPLSQNGDSHVSYWATNCSCQVSFTSSTLLSSKAMSLFLSQLSKYSSWNLFSTPTTCKPQLVSNQNQNRSQQLKTTAAVNSIAECSEGILSV